MLYLNTGVVPNRFSLDTSLKERNREGILIPRPPLLQIVNIWFMYHELFHPYLLCLLNFPFASFIAM